MRRRRRHYKPVPVQSNCRRCDELFCYFKTSKPRLYCTGCVELERRDANAFFNALAKIERARAA
jgi:hypothetical protein